MQNSAINVERTYTMNKNLIVIVGPTAIGKTSLSIQLAQHFKCEIISADSRQFYKEMQIGTAVPSEKELSEVKHHCIQHKSIAETYSVGDFEKEAIARLDRLFATHNYAILIGGSGLYIDAVTKGLDLFPEVAINIREKIRQAYTTDGIEYLQKQLRELDPVYFQKVDIQNPHRMMRALEVSMSSGLPYSSFITDTKKKRSFTSTIIGIMADREVIYDRINKRVDIMMEQGLVDEVTTLLPYKKMNALNTVGYKELFKYLENEIDLDTAIAEIKKNTRRFAKRQLTWFQKNDNIQWFDYKEDVSKIIPYIKKGQDF